MWTPRPAIVPAWRMESRRLADELEKGGLATALRHFLDHAKLKLPAVFSERYSGYIIAGRQRRTFQQ
jgi:hypothetical protein